MESNSAFASQMKKERENGGRQPFSLFFGAASGIYPEGHKLRLPAGKRAKKSPHQMVERLF